VCASVRAGVLCSGEHESSVNRNEQRAGKSGNIGKRGYMYIYIYILYIYICVCVYIY